MNKLNTNKLLTQKELIKRINQTTKKQRQLLELLIANSATPVSIGGERYAKKYKG
jgi:hypothetical protein